MAHRSRVRRKWAERYAQWILTHWVNDLTHLYWNWIESNQVHTFEELRQWFGISAQ